MNSNRYKILAGGKYLESRFGFSFPDEVPDHLVALGDVIFAQAQDLDRQRQRLASDIEHLEKQFGWMLQSLKSGDRGVWQPTGMGVEVHPYQRASDIEDRERALSNLLEAFKGLLSA